MDTEKTAKDMKSELQKLVLLLQLRQKKEQVDSLSSYLETLEDELSELEIAVLEADLPHENPIVVGKTVFFSETGGSHGLGQPVLPPRTRIHPNLRVPGIGIGIGI